MNFLKPLASGASARDADYGFLDLSPVIGVSTGVTIIGAEEIQLESVRALEVDLGLIASVDLDVVSVGIDGDAVAVADLGIPDDGFGAAIVEIDLTVAAGGVTEGAAGAFIDDARIAGHFAGGVGINVNGLAAAFTAEDDVAIVAVAAGVVIVAGAAGDQTDAEESCERQIA
jgi:hypothetical protein